LSGAVGAAQGNLDISGKEAFGIVKSGFTAQNKSVAAQNSGSRGSAASLLIGGQPKLTQATASPLLSDKTGVDPVMFDNVKNEGLNPLWLLVALVVLLLVKSKSK
jgi:hypothetical protein